MKSLTVLTFLLALNPRASLTASTAYVESLVASIAYDENSSADRLTVVTLAKADPQLTANHEDLTRAHIVAVINKSPLGSSSQIMRVYVEGSLAYEWKVSTGREQVEVAKSGRKYTTTTPVGYFRPTTIELNHYSQTWKSNMPHAVFFNGGIAVHASTHIEQLGKRASGGCIRLAPENAKIFYELIQSNGPKDIPRIDRKGKTVLDEKGNPALNSGWDVLIIVENHA